MSGASRDKPDHRTSCLKALPSGLVSEIWKVQVSKLPIRYGATVSLGEAEGNRLTAAVVRRRERTLEVEGERNQHRVAAYYASGSPGRRTEPQSVVGSKQPCQHGMRTESLEPSRGAAGTATYDRRVLAGGSPCTWGPVQSDTPLRRRTSAGGAIRLARAHRPPRSPAFAYPASRGYPYR